MLTVLVVMNVPLPTNVTMVLNEMHYALSFDVVRELHLICQDFANTVFPRLEGPAALALVIIGPCVVTFLLIVIGLTIAYKKIDAAKIAFKWIYDKVFFSVPIRIVFATYIHICIAANIGSWFQLDYFKVNMAAVIYLGLCVQLFSGFLIFSE
jgi:hypothetical protein